MSSQSQFHRVVITGLGLTSPIGNSVDETTKALLNGRSGITVKPEWAEIGHLETRLAGEVSDVKLTGFPRKRVRGMGRVALLGLVATEQAVEHAGLDRSELSNPRIGLAYGSTHGSSSALIDFVEPLLANTSFRGIPSSSYLKFMSHTCAANLALFYEIKGRIIPTSAACVSSSLAIGYGYEAIKVGAQDVMICGGAEELHFVPAGVFDIMMATSRHFNDQPERSPRPFDANRDGLVIGEGSATLILESLEHAQSRGAKIYGEIIGYGTNCDGTHLTSPSAEGMSGAMGLALSDAGISADELDYVNAHATATDVGDVAESHATAEIVGPKIPVSSTKSYTGHTLGACGGLEAIFCLSMMEKGFLAPNRNLDQLDSNCAKLNYLTETITDISVQTVMTNNFAFGGINTSLIFQKL